MWSRLLEPIQPPKKPIYVWGTARRHIGFLLKRVDVPTTGHKPAVKDHTHVCCLGYFPCWTLGQLPTIAPCIKYVREEIQYHHIRQDLSRTSITDRNAEHVSALVGFSHRLPSNSFK